MQTNYFTISVDVKGAKPFRDFFNKLFANSHAQNVVTRKNCVEESTESATIVAHNSNFNYFEFGGRMHVSWHTKKAFSYSPQVQNVLFTYRKKKYAIEFFIEYLFFFLKKAPRQK